MKNMRSFYVLLLMPLMIAGALLPGCDNSSVVSKGKNPRRDSDEEGVVLRTAVAPTGYGTITGKVMYDGTAPQKSPLQRGANEASCHAASPNDDENFDQTWIVGANGGVKNAVVMLQPTRGKYFAIPEEQRKAADIVILRQPRCAFIDHVFVMFPSYYDPAVAENEGQKRTGQKLIVKNDAPFDHNFSLNPQSSENRSYGDTLKPGNEYPITSLNPQTKPMMLRCNIHNWMLAWAFALEHPYAAVTKDDGSFEIKNIPVGVPVQVVAWHEGASFFNGGEDGKEMTLSANQVLDLPKIKKR